MIKTRKPRPTKDSARKVAAPKKTGRKPRPIEDKRADAERIWAMVAEGMTLVEIGAIMGIHAGNVLRRATETEEFAQHYAMARDAASDLFESMAIERARLADKDTAAADRLYVDTLKWAAGKRAPKRYGERAQIDHTTNGESLNRPATAEAALAAFAKSNDRE